MYSKYPILYFIYEFKVFFFQFFWQIVAWKITNFDTEKTFFAYTLWTTNTNFCFYNKQNNMKNKFCLCVLINYKWQTKIYNLVFIITLMTILKI